MWVAGGSDEHEVFGAWDEVELGEGADVSPIDFRLQVEGEGFEAPGLGQLGLSGAPGECLLLAGLPLRPQDAEQEFVIAQGLLFGAGDLLVEDLGDAPQMEAAQ